MPVGQVHFDGRGAGLVRYTAEGPRLFRDVRHSATYLKAQIALGAYDHGSIKQALDFVVRNVDCCDNRVSSLAEALYAIRLAEDDSRLRGSLTLERLRATRFDVEKMLHKCLLSVDGIRSEPIHLLGHSSQIHMSAFYTWWVLDAAGTVLATSDLAQSRQLHTILLDGLSSLAIDLDEERTAFPLLVGGSPDIGATSQIAESLLRFNDDCVFADSCWSFVESQLSPEWLREYPHPFMLWSIPSLFERIVANRSIRQSLV